MTAGDWWQDFAAPQVPAGLVLASLFPLCALVTLTLLIASAALARPLRLHWAHGYMLAIMIGLILFGLSLCVAFAILRTEWSYWEWAWASLVCSSGAAASSATSHARWPPNHVVLLPGCRWMLLSRILDKTLSPSVASYHKRSNLYRARMLPTWQSTAGIFPRGCRRWAFG